VKFKTGDRVVTSGVDDAGPGTILKRDRKGHWAVKFADTRYGTCVEAEELLSLDPSVLKTSKAFLGTQVGGSHYTDCAIQPIEYIWANKLGFSEGNIIKYVTRWKSKGGIKDLEKAQHHIALLIEHETSKGTK
jgi:hypothetical protein